MMTILCEKHLQLFSLSLFLTLQRSEGKAEKFADIFRSVVDIQITHPCSRTLKRCLSKTLQRSRKIERERVCVREKERGVRKQLTEA